jgi:hypothetical protein
MSEYYLLALLGYVAAAHAFAWGLNKLWWWYVDAVLAAAKGTRQQNRDEGGRRAARLRGAAEDPRGGRAIVKGTGLQGVRS